MTTESTPTETFESKVNEKINEATTEGERMLARAWKMIAANGVAAILFGFVLVLWPDIGLTTIVAVVAVYALVRAFCPASLRSPRRSWAPIEPGCCSKRRSGPRSASRCSSGTTSPRRRSCTWWRLGDRDRHPHAGRSLPASPDRRAKRVLALNGLVAGAFGAVMFIEPDVGAVAIVALIAALFVVIGVMHVGFALELRNIAADVRDRFPRTNTAKPVAHG